MIGSFSLLDIALVAISLISALLAMYRGLTREILSILSWALAAAALLYFLVFQQPLAQDVANQVGLPLQVAQILIGALLFLIVLVIVHLITSRLSDSVLDSRVGLFDQIFGFLFGLARGFVLIMILFLGYEKLFPPTPEIGDPVWISQSYSAEPLRATGSSLETFVIDIMSSLEGSVSLDGDHKRYALAIRPISLN